MILMQTKAIMIDAYRELNAKKLFWITMALSLLVVLFIASIGINENGVQFLWFKLGFIPVTTDLVSREEFYMNFFSLLGITIWLTWIATILALISTSGIIPDLISGGTIETTLSKPISRYRLFLSKYFSGLLFVALQVGVFSAASFFVIGLRAQIWEPRLFLAIPIVLAFFSYLYSVSVFVGMITKAAMPAIMLTCLFWAMLFVLNSADSTLTVFKVQNTMIQEQRISRIDEIETNTTRLIRSEMNREDDGSGDDYEPSIVEINERNPFLPPMRADLEKSQENLNSLKLWSGIIYGVKTILPKTSETSALLSYSLVKADEESVEEIRSENDDPNVFSIDSDEMGRQVEDIFRSRPLWWVLGTSFLFEGFLVLFCTWRFSRRDF